MRDRERYIYREREIDIYRDKERDRERNSMTKIIQWSQLIK